MNTAGDAEQEKTWRIAIDVGFPAGLAAAEPGEEGSPLPTRLSRRSRIPTDGVVLDGIPFRIRVAPKQPESEPFHLGFQLGQVVTEVRATSPFDAARKVQPGLERLLENLSFQMQAALIPGQIDVLDVTPPVAAGDEREVALYHRGEPLTAFRQFQDFGLPQGLDVGDLALAAVELPNALRAAQRWYTKALASPFEHDQFMCLWIALETLWEASDVRLRRPYRHGDHVIEVCPVCGEYLPEMESRGASIIAFLTGKCGVSPGDAADLWELRQMFHGQAAFSRKKLAMLSDQLQKLWHAVFWELSVALELNPSDVVRQIGGQPILGSLGLGGRRRVAHDDLEGGSRPPDEG